MRSLFLSSVLLVAVSVSAPAMATKSCDELKTEISAKIEAKKVTGYTLTVVDQGEESAGAVVGTCEGGSKKIVYTKK